MLSWVSPENHVLDGVQMLPREEALLGKCLAHCKVNRKSAMPVYQIEVSQYVSLLWSNSSRHRRWQVKLCDFSLTHINLSALEMSIAHIIRRCTNVLFTYFSFG